jgi:hypothetical protein
MALSKLGSRGITDGSILAADFAPGSVPADKLAGSIENSKLSNSTITIGGQAISLGGTDNSLNLVDWQSKITSDGSTVTTMVSGRGYFVDNSSAAGLVKLPASASIGDFVAIKDYAGNFGTNNLTIQRNSHNIQGVANDSLISTNRASLVLVYVDATKGWLYIDEHNVASLAKPIFTEATGGTITTSGDFKIHTFTGDGCFVVSTLGNSPTIPTGGPSNVDYLAVAGGGASARGQNGFSSGGGGAGGYRTTFPSPGCNAGAFPISATTYPVTVGGGGGSGQSGSNSIFSTITSAGGGSGNRTNGTSGGSGGGGGSNGFCSPTFGTGGSGNTPPVSPPQGNSGGNGDGNQPTRLAGGGGGAGGAGTTGNGGAGSSNSITGSSVTYAGGGGGGAMVSPAGSGGSGGGGNGGFGGSGSPQSLTPSTGGSANTGGGGGGYFAYPSQGDPASLVGGGSGIVIIRYKYQ